LKKSEINKEIYSHHMEEFNFEEIKPLIESAFREDIGSGDITTNSIVPGELMTQASMKAKSAGVIAGLSIAETVFRLLDPSIVWEPLVKEGDPVKTNDLLVKIKGSYRALLSGERTALNFLQRMSGIATETAKYVEILKSFPTKVLDTRKTVPGFRILDKYAVKMGGGTNHRIGLYDMVLIKDNHIKVAGGIKNAGNNVRKNIPDDIRIEVETTNLDEVMEAIEMKAAMIMLDNMSNQMMAQAVKLINGRAKVEASGNMTLERLREVAETGVDFISIGALTHSVKAMDISMNIETPE
jgi:nicotinate-nucleotide pyrophosphorylase (carboxylating)